MQTAPKFEIGDRVLARAHYRDEFRAATVADPSTFDPSAFPGSNPACDYVIPVEFDTAGGRSSRRMTVEAHNVRRAA